MWRWEGPRSRPLPLPRPGLWAQANLSGRNSRSLYAIPAVRVGSRAPGTLAAMTERRTRTVDIVRRGPGEQLPAGGRAIVFALDWPGGLGWGPEESLDELTR